jgi:hypothetical protein
MAKSTVPGDYAVGYRKPPKHTQFQPGQSGNRSGRPKQAPSMARLLRRELDRKVTITENGQARKITLQEAALRQITTKAAKGDSKALQMLLGLRAYIDAPLDAPADALHPDDQAVFDAVLERLRASRPPVTS